MTDPKPIEDGGPAFPVLVQWSNGQLGGAQVGAATGWHEGLSLRDYFAAKAMAAMVAGEGARMVADRDERYDGTNWAEIVAKNAYEFADEMLAQRAKGGGA